MEDLKSGLATVRAACLARAEDADDRSRAAAADARRFDPEASPHNADARYRRLAEADAARTEAAEVAEGGHFPKLVGRIGADLGPDFADLETTCHRLKLTTFLKS